MTIRTASMARFYSVDAMRKVKMKVSAARFAWLMSRQLSKESEIEERIKHGEISRLKITVTYEFE